MVNKLQKCLMSRVVSTHMTYFLTFLISTNLKCRSKWSIKKHCKIFLNCPNLLRMLICIRKWGECALKTPFPHTICLDTKIGNPKFCFVLTVFQMSCKIYVPKKIGKTTWSWCMFYWSHIGQVCFRILNNDCVVQ